MLAATLALVAGQAASAYGLPSLDTRQTTPAAFVSSNDGTLKLSSTTPPVMGDGSPGSASTWKITVNDGESGYMQKITGFGAAITDATVSVFNALSSSDQSTLMNEIFSPSGANFNLLRHTIGASDMSPTVYTYDDTVNDTSLSDFSLGSYGNAMTALLKQIKGVQSDLELLGSVWSPPGWLKLNGVTSGQTLNNNLNLSRGNSLAEYFVKYIQAYEDAGVTVNAVTLQNEPLNSQDGYPTCYVSDTDEITAINDYLGPAFANAGISTELWGFDHNTQFEYYPQAVVEQAGKYVSSIAWHCYSSPNVWGTLTDFHNANPNVNQYMTECWTSPETDWYQVLNFTSGPLQNWANGVMAWTLASDENYGPHLSGGCTSCRGLVTVDTSGTPSYTLNTDFYFLAQYSKYIQKGATMLSTTGSYDYGNGDRIEAVASLNPDNTRTIVLWNGFDNEVYLKMTTASGETWSGPLYSQSATTWLLPAAS